MLNPRFPFMRFLNAGESFYGEGSVKALSAIRNTKTLIVTTKSVAAQEYFKTLTGFIRSDELLVMVSPFKGEPKKAEIFKALAEFEGFQPDVVVAIGGGSIIDGAKLLWYFYEKGDLGRDEYERVSSPGSLSRLDFYAVPTTCGTGSEVSSSAVLNDEHGKIPVVCHDFLPKAFFLDPNLLTTLPIRLRIETSVDALTHAGEGYVSKIDNPLMDIFAVNALSIIRQNIFASIKEPEDKDLLLNLQIGAMLAGLVQNHCLVGLGHSISHAIGGLGLSHGLLNMFFFKQVVAFNSRDEAARLKYGELFEKAGFSSLAEGVEFIDGLKDIYSASLGDYIGKDKVLDASVLGEIESDRLTAFNPLMPTRDDIKDIIEKTYEL